MKQHRNPQASVSDTEPADNFNPGTALEQLYTELVDVEALAHAAGEAVTLLPSATSPEQRRHLARIYTLVTRTASEASAALALGESLVGALSSHTAARRTDQRPPKAAERGTR